MKSKQKWLVMEMDGWIVILPNFDSLPHSNDTKGRKRELAGLGCPCNPKIDVGAQIITHNSFIDRERVNEALKQKSPRKGFS